MKLFVVVILSLALLGAVESAVQWALERCFRKCEQTLEKCIRDCWFSKKMGVGPSFCHRLRDRCLKYCEEMYGPANPPADDD
ncbi:hypothetical protein LSAT2_032307 [Lamellibrachia satsuma]|nr:hypothetical protein LSAT2_032307 [Lamellibrachia satsuma]